MPPTPSRDRGLHVFQVPLQRPPALRAAALAGTPPARRLPGELLVSRGPRQQSRARGQQAAAHDVLEQELVALIQAAVERFQQQKLNHCNTISVATWNKPYRPVREMSVLLLTGPKPPGRPGSRMRQIRCQSLTQFLRHCVQREQFPGHWLPPTDLSHQVGRHPAGVEGRGGGDPISDAEILRLHDALPDDSVGQRWRDAIRLLAELGLRPVELLHLSVVTDRSTGVPHWWCNYRKRSGGGITEPRRIYPLPLQDDGTVVSWHLLERWKARLIQLPPLHRATVPPMGSAAGSEAAFQRAHDVLVATTTQPVSP